MTKKINHQKVGVWGAFISLSQARTFG